MFFVLKPDAAQLLVVQFLFQQRSRQLLISFQYGGQNPVKLKLIVLFFLFAHAGAIS